MSSDSVYEKLRFNGFLVAYWDHGSHCIEFADYTTVAQITACGYTEFPTVEAFVSGMFHNFGDVVGLVTDTSGRVLYDNQDAMREIYDSTNAR